ncbi:hypothetical protein NDU88_002651 [Pleurodeles waltl]|uniref:Uncharacterized protein n=1 Tax=Pleurodeles waltl TaxID=8319 RepID=A0AAV7UBP4_PLEWA|nr:hypothetical protein NDU88_002651 [Pleurodeles waltl]
MAPRASLGSGASQAPRAAPSALHPPSPPSRCPWGDSKYVYFDVCLLSSERFASTKGIRSTNDFHGVKSYTGVDGFISSEGCCWCEGCASPSKFAFSRTGIDSGTM